MGFLEDQKKKLQELKDEPDPEVVDGDAAPQGEAEGGPETADVSEGPSRAFSSPEEEIADLENEVKELAKQNEILKEQIQELEGEGKVGEGWMGPHEAAALREENMMFKVKVQNQQRTIQRLRQQANVGHR